ncbi:MAG: glutamate racemase [Candidatus Omnitrophica bacterium]|nr:glutamate racemase [Candidatus Omnitrophota bacterium]
MKEKPIGIFDSGIGGLTVLRQVRREVPKEDIVYFGDTAHVPYGTKSKETITKFSVENVKFLQTFEVKAVVVACNTASSLSLDALKAMFSIPIIGVIEPGAKRALETTKNGRVGVIGTKATIHSGSYEACLKQLDPSVKVFSGACPLFVPLVEEGWLDGPVVSKVAHVYLDQLKSFKIDTLILGCTHYPLLAETIQKTIGPRVRLVNSAEETARQTRVMLDRLGLSDRRKDQQVELQKMRRRKDQQSTTFYVSDEPEQFRMLGERFLGQSIQSVAKVGDCFSYV